MKFPEGFKDRMLKILKEEYSSFENCVLNEKNVRGLRVNTKKIPVSEFLKISPYYLEKVLYNNDGFVLDDDKTQMGGEPYHQAGMFYMQEPSAMIPVNSVEIKPSWKVLDLCAAPGGKTSQISNALAGEGFVIANDIKFDRCRALKFNIERLGLDNVIITSSDSKTLCKNFSNYFDMVLIDATCSGEGMFRKNPNLIATWSPKNIKRCAEIQKDLLSNASKTLKKGGVLVYSTCTFSTEENEQMVYEFLKSNVGFELVEAKKDVRDITVGGVSLNDELDFSKMRRFYPHLAKGEGQFVAILKKTEKDGDEYCNLLEKETAVPNEVTSFLASVGFDIEKERIFVKGNKVWLLPKAKLSLKSNVISYGVKLGEIEGGELIPDHAFFMAYGNRLNNQINFEIDDVQLGLYLEGKRIKYPAQNGWGAVLLHGCTLGGFYSKGGIVESRYPNNLTNKDIFNS